MQNIEQAEDVVIAVVGRCLLMVIVLIVFGCGIGRKTVVGIIILNQIVIYDSNQGKTKFKDASQTR